MIPTRRAAASACWLAALVAAVVALQLSGAGVLAAPPLAHPDRLAPWLLGREPVAAVLALVRVAALGAAWYLLVATVVGVSLRLTRARRWVAVADRLTVPPLRRLLAGTLGMGMLASASGALALVVPPRPPQLATASQPAPGPSTTAGVPPTTVTMHRLPPPGSAPETPTVLPPSRPAPTVAGPERWTVQPGQCFWSIAEAVLRQAWGRPPADAEIVPYWRRLIDANRPALAHPGDPDLIFPGQVFDVPAV